MYRPLLSQRITVVAGLTRVSSLDFFVSLGLVGGFDSVFMGWGLCWFSFTSLWLFSVVSSGRGSNLLDIGMDGVVSVGVVFVSWAFVVDVP